MSVLIEAISIVIPMAVIKEKYPEGWQGFLSAPQNPDTICSDGELLRTAFMNPYDADWLVGYMEKKGLIATVDGEAKDLVVVDRQRGFLSPCSWAELIHFDISTEQRVAACKLKGGAELALSHPQCWSYENSLSKTSYTIALNPFRVEEFS
jgi:hypothetical protein